MLMLVTKVLNLLRFLKHLQIMNDGGRRKDTCNENSTTCKNRYVV